MSQERGLVWLTRLGFAARGFLYLIIAGLAIGTGRAEDLKFACIGLQPTAFGSRITPTLACSGPSSMSTA